MGCDYYIVRQLRIDYTTLDGKQKKYIHELDRQRCYFTEYDVSCDSDDTEYHDRMNALQSQMIESCLRVQYKPRSIYENGQWKNKEVEAKYMHTIVNTIGATSQLVSIVKEEVRYLR